MNLRYVLVLAALLLVVVEQVAGEGGAVDQLAHSVGSGEAEGPPAPPQMASASPQGAASFFSDYEPPVDDTQPESEPARSGSGYAAASARKRPELGALSKEQLNVEEPVGLASMREERDRSAESG